MTALARRLTVFVCALTLAVFASACRNTAVGVKRDAEENSRKAAVKASEAADKASQAAEAAAQTMNVKTALLADTRVTAKGIDVDTDRETKTVTLKGHVPTEEQKTIAEQIAVERASGYRVRNELTIGN